MRPGTGEAHHDGEQAVQLTPELADEALRACHAGHILAVWQLDRLGRRMKHWVEIVEDLQHRGIGFQVLTGVQFDTITLPGMLALQRFAVLAEYERALIRERVLAGLAAARACGRKERRRPKLSPEQQPLAADMARGGMPITTIAQTLRCSRHTVSKALAPSSVVRASETAVAR
jgi:DNA invertase Pin-like site-specific DNA recombinase